MGDEGKLYVPQELISVYCERARQGYLIGNKALAKELNAKGQVHNMHIKAAHGKAQESIYRQRIQSEDDGRKACNFLHEARPSKGTGDLMTALLLGWSNKYPDNLEITAELAVSSLQAVLQRTLNDYKSAGHDPQSTSLEIRLIQSQDDIRSPEIKFKAEIYS